MTDHHHHSHEDHSHSHSHEKRTQWVTIITFFAMIGEILAGYYTGSVALLADGWHMSSHVLAMGLAWIAYRIMHQHKDSTNFSHGSDKVLSLSGYTSALILLLMSVFIFVESIGHLITPAPIKFFEAIIVAVLGLIVNGVSAIFLHHDHEHSDHNIKAAYLHVVADLFTSVLAIIALAAGKYFQVYYLDAVCGIISGGVVLKWAIGLLISSGQELVGYKKAG